MRHLEDIQLTPDQNQTLKNATSNRSCEEDELKMSELKAKTKAELNMILSEVINRVLPVFGEKLKKVILYGSYARGDYDAESDVDVMFIIDEAEDKIVNYRKGLRQAMAGIDLKYDALICGHIQNHERFMKYMNDVPFYSNISREGIVYYEQ
ncbi:MAG TPA: nucleotidyltransferase domain-containing protein [Bacillota bacterium]|nr:nucleotidyltransferase domain-containing protein [Bacillota bacterium]